MKYSVILFLLFKSDFLFACNCAELGLNQRFSEASEVFVAHITDTTEVVLTSDEMGSNDRKRIKVQYSLIETFKGAPEPSGHIFDTDISIDTCSLGMTADVDYMIFLYNSKHVKACGGTQRYSSTRDRDLVKKLRELDFQ